MAKQQKQSEKEMLIEIIKINRWKWFCKKLREIGMYTDKWNNAYMLYLETRLQDDVISFKDELLMTDIGVALKDLIEFLIWQDTNFANKDTERYLYKYDEE